MANLLEHQDIKWSYHKHRTLSSHSHFVYRDNHFGVQREIITNRDGHGGSGKPKNYFFIDGIEREFTEIETLCECWNERNNFDDPKNEIIWEKKIVPIINMRLVN